MPSRNLACPTEEELLRFTSGDLSDPHAAKVQAHLRQCPACAEQIRAWGETLDAYQQHTANDRDIPQWEGFGDGLRRTEDAWRRQRAARVRRRWAAAAAIAASVLAGWFWQRQTEVVLSAQEVITRAVLHEQERPSPESSAVRVSEVPASTASGRRNSFRIQGTAASTNGAIEFVSSRGPVARELAARLAGHGFDWAAPLSAKHFQHWRRTANAAKDRVLPVDGAFLRVSTMAEGAIPQAEIIVRQDTYEPVAQHWRFADGFEVELTTLAEKPAVEAPSAVVASPEIVKPATPPTTAPADLEAIELDARTTLHRLGAVVGSELTIRQARGRIRIHGDVSGADTARQIAGYVGGQRFVDAKVSVRPASAARDVAPASASLRPWLDQALPPGELRSTFVSRTWELRDQILKRAGALDELAQRYPRKLETELSPDSRRKLTELAGLQYHELTDGYEGLERQLAPLIGTVSRPVMPTALPTDWRSVGGTTRPAIDRLTGGLESVFISSAASPPDTIVHEARATLRPALEALANGIASQP